MDMRDTHRHRLIRALKAGMLLCAMAVMPLASRATTPVPPADRGVDQAALNRQRVDAAFDRWAAGDTGFFADMLSPDVVWTIEGSSASAGTYRGLEDFRARALVPFASRLRVPVRPVSRTVWADGDHVIIHWEGHAVAADDAPYRNRYVWIFRMQEGKAVEVHAFLDLAAYEDVIRRIPAPSHADGAR